MIQLKHFFFILSLVLLVRCDCLQNAQGTVVDAVTLQPIANVDVHKKGKVYDKDLTDELGSFHITSISGGLKRCPPITAVFSKTGYRVLESEVHYTDTIYLVPHP